MRFAGISSLQIRAGQARHRLQVQRRALASDALNARSVFVTNLSFKITEQELRDWLASAGEVKSVKLSRDKVDDPGGLGQVSNNGRNETYRILL